MTHKIKNKAAQGDLLCIRVGAIPATHKPKKPDDGSHIVAHSETGHHHLIDALHADYYVDDSDPMTCYLRIDGEADLVHMRTYDTHETLTLTKGTWQLRRQREYTPEGWRRVED